MNQNFFIDFYLVEQKRKLNFSRREIEKDRIELKGSAFFFPCIVFVNLCAALIRRGELSFRSHRSNILISLVDWTLAIIDPLKSSGLSPVSVCPLETRFASYSVSCKKKKNYYFVQLVQQELIFANEIAKSSCIYVYIYMY